MTLTLPSDTPKRLDLSTAYPKDYPADRAPIRHLTEWFDNHPPEPHPVRIRPVERAKTQEDADLDYLCKPIHLEVDTPWDRSVGKLKHERDLWHERFWLVLIGWLLTLIFGGWVTYNQMQRIRAYQAASEGRATIVDYSTIDRSNAESFSKNGSGAGFDSAPQGAE